MNTLVGTVAPDTITLALRPKVLHPIPVAINLPSCFEPAMYQLALGSPEATISFSMSEIRFLIASSSATIFIKKSIDIPQASRNCISVLNPTTVKDLSCNCVRGLLKPFTRLFLTAFLIFTALRSILRALPLIRDRNDVP